MEITYKRSMSSNYIILHSENTEEHQSYQICILLENQVPGLLTCKKQRIDGQSFFYYEITGCQSLWNLFEKQKFKRRDLEELFKAVIKIMECLDQYLLNRDFLVLNPSYVYRNMDSQSYFFLWFPYSEEAVEKRFREMTEYILPRIDHTDQAAVTLGYSIYKESMEDSICLEKLKVQIFSMEEKCPEKKTAYEAFETEEHSKEKERQKILDDFYSEEEEKLPIDEKKGAVVVLAVFMVLLVGIGYFISLWLVFLLAGLFICIAVPLGVLWYKKRNAEDEEEKVSQSLKVKERFGEEEYFKSDIQEAAEKTVLLKEEMAVGAYLKEMESGKKYFLKKEMNLIGKRNESVDICLDIPTVSRMHAKILRREQGDFLIDLNSRNGTLLNGKYIDPEKEYILKNEDIIIFAQIEVCYISQEQ